MVIVLKVTASDGQAGHIAEPGVNHQKVHYVQHVGRAKQQAKKLSSTGKGMLVGEHITLERVYIDEGSKSVVYEYTAPALTSENIRSVSGAELNQLEKEGTDYSHESVRQSEDIWFLIEFGWKIESCLLTQEGIILVNDIFDKRDIL